MAEDIQEPEGIEHFTPDTPVQCIYHLTGGSKSGCDWKGTFKDLIVEVGQLANGQQVYIRCCPHCDCPFVISDPKLREFGKLP